MCVGIQNCLDHRHMGPSSSFNRQWLEMPTLFIPLLSLSVCVCQLSEHKELRSVLALGHHPFYEEALEMAEEGTISCRVLR